MTFYCISSKTDSGLVSLLQKACEQRSVPFQELNAAEVNYTNLPQLGKGDIIYRCTAQKIGRILENQLVTEDVTTFFATFQRALSLYPDSFTVHQRYGLPITPTIANVTPDRELLRQYVEHLGGFPIILKAVGGSHGVGVMKIDSFASLFSVVDLLTKHQVRLILRKYIQTETSARLIVLGDRVVDSIEYQVRPDDFRSNEGKAPIVKGKKFSSEIEDIAVKAVQAMDYEFGGVDILIDPSGKPYIAEVNMPCNFARAQNCTGVDIAGQMVEYLLNKAAQA